jgi:hypothetical protein
MPMRTYLILIALFDFLGALDPWTRAEIRQEDRLKRGSAFSSVLHVKLSMRVSEC